MCRAAQGSQGINAHEASTRGGVWTLRMVFFYESKAWESSFPAFGFSFIIMDKTINHLQNMKLMKKSCVIWGKLLRRVWGGVWPLDGIIQRCRFVRGGQKGEQREKICQNSWSHRDRRLGIIERIYNVNGHITGVWRKCKEIRFKTFVSEENMVERSLGLGQSWAVRSDRTPEVNNGY